MSGRGIFAAGLALGSLWGSPSWAYVPPSQYILRGFVAKRVGYKNVFLKSQAVLVKDAGSVPVTVKVSTAIDGKSRRARIRFTDESGRELYGTERLLFPDSVFVKAGATPSAAHSAPSPLPQIPAELQLSPGGALLLESNLEALGRKLITQGIPVKLEAELSAMKDEDERRAAERTGLVRLPKTEPAAKQGIAWSVGEGLWVEKDTFLPLQLVAKAAGERVRAQFENYRFAREFPYPRRVTVSVDGEAEPWFREELAELAVNGDSPEMLGILRGSFSNGWTEAGNSADGAVRDLIKAYLGALR